MLNDECGMMNYGFYLIQHSEFSIMEILTEKKITTLYEY